METAFAADVSTVPTRQPHLNVESTPDPPTVFHLNCSEICECSVVHCLFLFVLLLVVTLYLIFLIFWLLITQKLRP